MSEARKLSLWLDGVGWLSSDRMADVPEDGAGPDGSAIPQIPGTQRLYADGGWYYCTTPANLATLMQAGGQVQPDNKPAMQMAQMNPMAMMQNAMAMKLMQSFGMGTDSQQETKPPIDLSQLSGPASIFGEKIKEAVLGAVQIWRAVKG